MAFLAAAPEAAAAVEGAGAAEGTGAAASGAGSRAARVRGKGKGRGRRITADMGPAEVDQELQRRKQEAADKAADKAQPAPTATATATSSPVLGSMDAVHTGSGMVLGVIGWVVFMNYMQGGMAQVRRWGAAKFLNRVGAPK